MPRIASLRAAVVRSSAVQLGLLGLLACVSTSSLTAQLLRVGAEFRVNSTTSGAQTAPAVASDPSGSFLVVWQSTGQDGSGGGIYARLFASDGSALSGELRVNETTAGDQITPAVSWSPAGFYLVAWVSAAQDGDGYGVYARRLEAATGVVAGGEFRVNVRTTGNQLSPKIATLGSTFYVAWAGLGTGGDTYEIYARGFSATTGAAVTNEILANSTVSGQQLQPAIGALPGPGGGLALAWSSEAQDGSGFGVFARRFSATLAPLSAEIAVPQNAIYDQSAPAVVGLSGGGFAVAWQRALQQLGSTVGPQPVISFRRFAGSVATGPEVQVQSDATRRHETPALIVDADDTLTVAWQETNLTTGDKQVMTSRFDSTNTPLVLDFPLNSTPAGDQIGAALSGASRIVAAWASFGQDGSSFGIYAQRLGTPVEPCVADSTTLCLRGGRFRVRATYATAAGATGSGHAAALTGDSGYYWFFNDANVEIVVKAIDACGLTGFDNFWIFATGLTNVQVDLDVVDTWTGEEKVYDNPLNRDFQPILDSGHFHVCNATAPSSATAEALQRAGDGFGRRGHNARLDTGAPTEAASPRFVSPAVSAASPEGSCTPNATTLCLQQGRFEVKIDYATAQGVSGDGQAVSLTADSGYFWFFDAANVELVIKVIDGCSYNDRFWVFAGGLTNVETHLTVRDTQNPLAVFTRVNPLNQSFAPILSIDAFDTCAP